MMDELRQKRTVEMGSEIVDERGKGLGMLGRGEGVSVTGELEMMRGELCGVLRTKAEEVGVRYRFGVKVVGVRELGGGEGVEVEMKERGKEEVRREVFDVVVGADGMRSMTRELVWGRAEEVGCYYPVGAQVAYFSVPKTEGDGLFAKLCQFVGRRVLWIRPVGEGADVMSCYLMHIGEEGKGVERLKEANASGDRERQKEALREVFDGCGWEMPRILKGMMLAENFYSEELVQVKLPRWSKGKVVLVGDAAWAPTPFTGQGNQLAIIGAWVLAQEMRKNQAEPVLAFETYEGRLGKYVEECQQIPLGGRAPYLCAPQTALGIWLFRRIYQLVVGVIQFAIWTGLSKILPTGGERWEEKYDLEMVETEGKKST